MSTAGTGEADWASGEDEEWLYGENDEEEEANPDDDNDEKKTETEVFSALVGKVEGVNGTASQDGDEESDSDSNDDDEVCVTIGNIKRGSSQSISSSSTPVSFNIRTSSRSTLSGSKSRELDLDALDSGVSVLEAGEESFEEKPWRKPGADLSDYFNYGFSEDTWKAYCDKQRRMRMSLEVMTLGSSTKTMVNYDPVDCPSRPDCSSRKSNTSTDVIQGQTGTISRVEGRRRTDENDTNVAVQSSDAEFQSTKPHPFLPLNIPPPPFPPLPISTTPSIILPPPRLPIRVPPPGFPIPSGTPSPPSVIPTVDSSHSGGSYEGRSSRSYPFSAGVFPPLLGGVGSWLDLMDSAKAWEYYTHHDKKRERERDREREWNRERERERERNRERRRDREHTPSSFQGRSSDEECVTRHRDHSDRERERHRERSSRADEREERYRERRHREHSERHKSSRSSYSRRRHTSDKEESHRRHRHKRSRRTRENVEPSEEHSAEHDNQSEATED